MDSREWIKLINLVPQQQRELLTLMTLAGTEIALQAVVRIEEHYTVVRGRISGTNDQDHIYFIPFDQISYAGFTRPVPVRIIAGMYGEVVESPTAAPPPSSVPIAAAPEAEPEPPPPENVNPAGQESSPSKDPSKARIPKASLLERIRARTSQT